MTPHSFKDGWLSEGDALVTFDAASVAALRIPEEARIFLATTGLPRDAAPFLTFGSKVHRTLPDAADLWNHSQRGYRAIGSNGFGDPICLVEFQGGRIVYLNHDDDMKVEFVNSSVPQLAYSLFAFRSAVRNAIAAEGKDAYLDNRIPSDIVDRFIGELEQIDPEAIKAERFWLRSILGEGT